VFVPPAVKVYAPVPVIELGLDVAVKVVPVAPKTAAVYVTVAEVSLTVAAVPIVGVSGMAALDAPIPILKLLTRLVLSDSLLVDTLTTLLKLGYFAAVYVKC
jgi:hypothetical protein